MDEIADSKVLKEAYGFGGENFRTGRVIEGSTEYREIKEIFNSIKSSPNYPEGFVPRANGTRSVKVNNNQLLERLREIEPANRAIAEQYRKDYLEDLISCDKYYEFKEILGMCAKKLSDGMDVFMEKDITMESFEKEVEKKFLHSENKEVVDEMIRKWGKKLICKAIIYRSFVCVEKSGKERKKGFFY